MFTQKDKNHKGLVLVYLVFTFWFNAVAQKKNNAIYSGVPWFDDKGNTVSAHGANIIKENGTYYLFGERHEDGTNAFAGFNCYSSVDLYNWKFESIALPQQAYLKLVAAMLCFQISSCINQRMNSN